MVQSYSRIFYFTYSYTIDRLQYATRKSYKIKLKKEQENYIYF
jgi:hypothetical protein